MQPAARQLGEARVFEPSEPILLVRAAYQILPFKIHLTFALIHRPQLWPVWSYERLGVEDG